MNGTLCGDGDIHTVAAISMAEGTGGLIMHNDVISDVTTALLMRIGDDMIFIMNNVSDTDGDEFSGSPEAGINNSTNSISGHGDG